MKNIRYKKMNAIARLSGMLFLVTAGFGLVNTNAHADFVHNADVIVWGLCASYGIECVDGEVFTDGADIKIKDATPVLYFQDTSLNHDDWLIDAGTDLFRVKNDTSGSYPFIIEAGAASNLLYLDSAERIGINTSVPAQELDIRSASPAIRLDDTSAGAGRVDMGLSTNSFWITGNTDLGIFHMDTRAPLHSFFMNSSGNIGFGTQFPQRPIDVRGDGDDTAAQVYVNNQNTATPGEARKLFQIVNSDGPAKFSMFAGWGDEWAFNARTDVFRISKQGTGQVEMELNQNGNLTIVGVLSSGSSRTIKHDIAPVDTQKVLNQVLSMPVAEWTYNHDKGVRHMGPMSEDFHTTFGLGDSDKKLTTIDTSGVALAAIQGLSKEKDREIEALHVELQAKSLEIETLQSEMNNLRAMVQLLMVKDKIVMAD